MTTFDSPEEELLLSHSVTEEESGKRLDLLAAEVFDLTRSEAARHIAEGNLTVNAEAKQKRYAPRAGEILTLKYPA